MKHLVLVFCVLVLVFSQYSSQQVHNYYLSHVAGGIGDGGNVKNAIFSTPNIIRFNSKNELFIADTGNNKIRKVDVNDVITTVVGTGSTLGQTTSTNPTKLPLNGPVSIALDSKDNLYITDNVNHVIRKLDITTGKIATVLGGSVGSVAESALSGLNMTLNTPKGITFDAEDNMYVSDTTNHRILKMFNNGTVITIAGKRATSGYLDGVLATDSLLKSPSGLFFDNSLQELYIADTTNNRIRKIMSNGTITTIVGTGNPGLLGTGGLATAAQINGPTDIVFWNGSMIIAENNDMIRRVDSNGKIYSLTATSGSTSFKALASTSRVKALGLTVGQDGALYFSTGSFLAKIYSNDTMELLNYEYVNNKKNGENLPAYSTAIGSPLSIIETLGGDIIFSIDHAIYNISKDTGIATRIAGVNGNSGEFSGDGGDAKFAGLSSPLFLQYDEENKHLYFLDGGNKKFRRISSDGIITTVANTTNSYIHIRGAVMDSQLNFIYYDFADSYLKKTFSSNDTTINLARMLPGASGVNVPFNLYLDKNDTLYSIDKQSTATSGPSIIYKYNSDFTRVLVASVPFLAVDLFKDDEQNFFIPHNTIATGSYGNLGKISVYSSITGECKQIAGFDGPRKVEEGVALEVPIGSAKDLIKSRNGSIYFTDWNSSGNAQYIRKLTPISCFGLYSYSSNACSSNGYCTNFDTCTCKDGFYGKACEYIVTCNGIQFNDSSVCSGNGTCSNFKCNCNPNLYGEDCSLYTCFGKLSNDSTVCSGHGTCFNSTCTCGSSWTGADCSQSNIQKQQTSMFGGSLTLDVIEGSSKESIVFGNIQSTRVLSNGDVIVSDSNRILIIRQGKVHIMAGTGENLESGDTNSNASTVPILLATGMVVDPTEENLYFCEKYRIRKINLALGNISTVVGIKGTQLNLANNGVGSVSNTPIYGCSSVAIGQNGEIFFTEKNIHEVKKVENGFISVIAGNRLSGYTSQSSLANSSSISYPDGISFSNITGSLYVSSSDSTNSISVIYEITNSGILKPIAGSNSIGSSGLGSSASNSKLSTPNDIVFFNGELFISEKGNCRVTKITANGTIEKVAGLDTCPSTSDSSTEYKTVAIATSYYLPKPSSITIINNKLYIGAELIYEVDLTSGKIVPFAGEGSIKESDGYTANDLLISGSSSMFVYSSSEFYLTSDGRLIRILEGRVTTIMGSFSNSAFYSGGSPQRISNSFPLEGIVSPNLIFSSKISFITKDRVIYFFNNIGSSYYLQSLDIETMVVHTFSNGSTGVLNEGSVSTSTSIQVGEIFVDDNKNIYVTQPSNHIIIKINSENGILTRIAGTPSSSGNSTDGTLAINAQLNTPKSIYVYPNGDILFTDSQNNALKKIKLSDGKIEKVITSLPTVTGIIVSGDDIYLGYPNNIVRINNGTEYPFAGTGQPPQLSDLQTIGNTESTSAKISATYFGIFGGTVYSLTTANSVSVILSFDAYFTCNITCNNGACSSESTCQCEIGWSGERCDSLVACNGKYYNDSTSCGGTEHGKCISPNMCSCKTGYFGNECNLVKCFDILSNETSSVCSGHGICSGTDNCTCKDGWKGANCSELIINSNGINNSSNTTCGNVTCNNSTIGNSTTNNSTDIGNNSTSSNSTNQFSNTTDGNSTLNNTMDGSNSTLNNSTNIVNNTTTNNTDIVNNSTIGNSTVNNSTDIGNNSTSNSTNQFSNSTDGNSTLNNTTDGSNSTLNNSTNTTTNNTDIVNNSTISGNSTTNNSTDIGNNSTSSNATNQFSNTTDGNSTLNNNTTDTTNSTTTNNTDIVNNNGNSGNETNNSTLIDSSKNSTDNCTCMNGVCKNSICSCSEGWKGSKCDVLISCFGKVFNDTQVCGGNGVCTDVDNCICSSNNSKVVINGTTCQNIYCESVNNVLIASTDNTVCNGMGTCSKNGCSCIPKFSGFDCQVNTSNIAKCPTNYYGNSCEKYCEVTSTCSSHGKCSSSGLCECFSDITNGFYIGTSCNECKHGFVGSNCNLGFFGPVQFSNFGDGFKFTYFNSFINTRLTNLNCSELFPESLRSKMGSNPVCSWVDRETGEFKVSFGIGATIPVGAEIIVNLNANSGSSPLYSSSIKLEQPINPVKPVIVIKKKDYYGVDDVITLDASLSYSGDKNDLLFTWSTNQNIPSINSLTNVFDRPVVIISKEESKSLASGTYTIQLVVTSQLLNLSNSEVFTFEKKSTTVPRVSIIGKSNIIAESRNLPIVIKKSADISDDSNLIIEWSKISNTAPVEYHVDEFNNLVITNFSNNGFNQVHEFQIKVKTQGDESIFSTSTVTVKQSPSPQTLDMQITQFNDEFIEFNVKNIDFDESLGTVLEKRVWSCEQQDGQPCDDSILTLLNSFNNQNQIKIKKSDLGSSASTQDSIQITLTITKNNLKSISKTLKVNIPKKDAAPVVNAVISKGRSTNKNGQQMLKMGDKFSIQLAPLKVDNSQQLERIWKLNGKPIEIEMLKYMKENVNLTKSNSIVLDTSKLEEGSINTIEVTIIDQSTRKSTVQEYTFGILSSPSSCSCKIYPLEGISFKTDFTFLCSNCQNEEASYTYEFGYLEPRNNIPIALIQYSNKVSAQLPNIDPSIQHLQVYYKIMDTLTGSESTTISQVKLSGSNNVTQALSVITNASPSSSSIQKMLKDGNTLQATTDIAISSSSLLSIVQQTTTIKVEDMESVSFIQSSLSENMNSVSAIYRSNKNLDYTPYELSNSIVGVQSLVSILQTVQNQNAKIEQLLSYSSYLESLLLLTEKNIQITQTQTLALQDSINKLFNLTMVSSLSGITKQQFNTRLSDITSTVALHLLDNQNVGEDSKELATEFTTIVYNKQSKDSLLPLSEKASLKTMSDSQISVFIPSTATVDLKYTDSNPIPYLVQVIDPSSTSHETTTNSSSLLLSSVLANVTIGYNSSNVKVYPNAEVTIPIQTEVLQSNPIGTQVIENSDGTLTSILTTMSCNIYSYGANSISCDDYPAISKDEKSVLCKCVEVGVIGVSLNTKRNTVLKSDQVTTDRPYYVIGIVLGIVIGIVIVLGVIGTVAFVVKKKVLISKPKLTDTSFATLELIDNDSKV